MQVTIDRDGCIGCGLCCSICPDVFRMADDGKAEVRQPVNASHESSAHKAAEDCPVSVIQVQ